MKFRFFNSILILFISFSCFAQESYEDLLEGMRTNLYAVVQPSGDELQKILDEGKSVINEIKNNFIGKKNDFGLIFHQQDSQNIKRYKKSVVKAENTSEYNMIFETNWWDGDYNHQSVSVKFQCGTFYWNYADENGEDVAGDLKLTVSKVEKYRASVGAENYCEYVVYLKESSPVHFWFREGYSVFAEESDAYLAHESFGLLLGKRSYETYGTYGTENESSESL